MDDTLLVGDLVWLYCEHTPPGYVFSLTSSSVDSHLYSCESQLRENPINVPDPQGFTFEIQLRNRYKLQKRYQRLLDDKAKYNIDASYEAQLAVAKVAAEDESVDNKLDQRRHVGRPLKYGQVIQLKHILTSKYVHVSTTQTSPQDKNHMAVHLKPYHAKQAQFKILPRFKVKSEGDIVQINDQIILESVKSPEQYLHASIGKELDSFTRGCEINLGVDRSGFTIVRYRRPLKGDEKHFKGGSCVRFYHKEIEAYIVAEGRFYNETETCHLRVDHPKTPSTEGTTFWQIEHQESIVNGMPLAWEQQVRIRHMPTRLYLTVNKEGLLCMTTDNIDGIDRDPCTVFKLFSVTKEQGKIQHGSYARIQHVLSGRWLHGQKNVSYSKKQDDGLPNMTWDPAPLKVLGLSDSCHYDDAFTMQEVTPEEIARFNFVAGMVPSVLTLSKDITSEISADQAGAICDTLQELKHFMIVNGEPEDSRQKLLRNLQIIDLLKDIIQKVEFIRTNSNNNDLMVKILGNIYNVMECYLMGDSRMNELYVAKHLPFFIEETQENCKSAQETSKSAMEMITELIRNNRQIVDSITTAQIDNFIRNLQSKNDYRYLQVLGTLCVCDGTTLRDNQNYIVNKWLKTEPLTGVYVMETEALCISAGESIVMKLALKGQSAELLHDFVTKKDDKNEKNRNAYLCFENQLDLFTKLCEGRNKQAIDLLTNNKEFCSMFHWDVVFAVISDTTLPDSLRALYCHLMVTLYLDAGDNKAVTDHTVLTYHYRPAGSDCEQEQPTYIAGMDRLKHWIMEFLDENQVMVANNRGTNNLIEQVLIVVFHLVKFGYIGAELKQIVTPLLRLLDGRTDVLIVVFHLVKFGYIGAELKQIVTPLLRLLDGRTDVPFKKENENQHGEFDAHNNYRERERFLCSPEAKHVVDAKLRALEVIEQVMKLQLDKRLHNFVMTAFRHSHNYKSGKSKHYQRSKVLFKLFSESYTPAHNKQTTLSAQRALEGIMAEDVFDEKELTEILLDLTDYQYHKLVCKSLHLVNKLYSTRHDVITAAMKTRLLINRESLKVNDIVKISYNDLRRLSRSKIGLQESVEIVRIMNQLAGFCLLEGSNDEVNEIMQKIIINAGIPEVMYDFLKQSYKTGNLVDVDSGMGEVTTATLHLYKRLSKGNVDMQDVVFDNVDSLLGLKGVEGPVASLLTQTFTSNHRLCLTIKPEQIHTIVKLVAQHERKVPELLALLMAIVKDEKLGVPLKKNQNLVMKYIMENYARVCSILHALDNTTDGVSVEFLVKGRRSMADGQAQKDENAKLVYFIALVDLLAACAEGENSFIESICQTILPLDDVFKILPVQRFGCNVKRPFLRFLQWTYLHISGGATSAVLKRLTTKIISGVLGELGTILRDAAADCCSKMSEKEKAADCSKKSEERKIALEHWLLQPANNCFLAKSEADWQCFRLHHIFDAVLPFLSSWLSHPEVYTIEVPLSLMKNQYKNIVENLMTFAEEITQKCVICKIQQIDSLQKAVVTAVSFAQINSSKGFKDVDALLARYQQLKFTEKPVRSAVAYQQVFAEELADNKIFRIFCGNFLKAYRGQSTVLEQLGPHRGVPWDREYTELGKDTELPLGPEFHKLVACYSANNFGKAQKLMEQLSFSSTHLSSEEQNQCDQVELDIKCLQILRAFIHNQERKIPQSAADSEKFKQPVKDIQNRLILMDVLGLTLSLPERNNHAVVKEYFAFANAMLLFANTNSQIGFKERFYGTREEAFFFAVKDRISKSVSLTKERRSLSVQFVTSSRKDKSLALALKGCTGNVDEEDEVFKDESVQYKHQDSERGFMRNKTAKKSHREISTVRQTLAFNAKAEYASKSISSMKSARDDKSIILLPEEDLNNNSFISVISKSPVKPAMKIICEDDRQPQALELSKFKDEGSVELMLNLLAKLCDGQYKEMQDYLRDQFDNYKSANLVADTTSFLSLLYTHIDRTNIDLVIQIFTTLNEMVSGNYENYFVVWENGISEYVNYILRTNSYENCSRIQILELWLSISALLLSILEEATSKSDQSLVDIKGFVDVKSIERITIVCHKDGVVDKTQKSIEIKELSLKVGFSYYFILQRLKHVEESCSAHTDECNSWDEDHQNDKMAAESLYDKQTKCIEILKNGHLQRVWFRVGDQNLLEQNVKEELKWNIDRSSATNKLRDLTDWTDDIIADINHKKRVRRFWPVKMAMDYWMLWNNLCFLLSFLISLLTLVSWEAKASLTDYKNNTLTPQIYDPTPVYPSWYRPILHLIGGFHTFLSFIIFFGYWTSKQIGIVDGCYADVFRGIAGMFHRKHREVQKKSRLQLKFYIFSLLSAYYVAFPVFSILGHIYHGYFFAFHLLVIVHTSQILKRVILAITQHGKQLLLVTFLGLILLYQFSLIAFASLRFAMDPSRDDCPMFCSSLGKCFVTIVRYGLVGELFEKMSVHDDDHNFASWGKLVSYHIFFFIIITTIGLNLIFGIILDTFSELRSQQSEAMNDMKNNCFICSRSAHEFDSYTKGGFKHHIQREHNMWDYIFFFMHLEETPFTDFTCVELYVHQMKEENKLEYFPINQALSLQGQDSSESDEKIDLILAKITAVMDRYDQEKADRERQNERIKQQKWEEQNRIQSTTAHVPVFSTHGTPSTSL